MRGFAPSYFVRLAAATGALVVLSTVATAWTASRIARARLLDARTEGLVAEARLLAEQAPAADVAASRADAVDAWVDRSARPAGARVTVVAPSGRVLGDSELSGAELASMESHAGRPEVLEAVEGGRGAAVRHSATVGVDFLYVAVPGPKAEGGRPSIVRVALPLEELRAAQSDLVAAIGGAGVACLLGVLALSFYLSRSLHRPLAAVALAAERIAAGDRDARVEGADTVELDRLGSAIGELSSRVSDSLSRLAAERAELSAILAHMTEAVVAIDPQLRILEANPALGRLLGIPVEAAKGRPLLETVRHEAVRRLLEQALEGKESRRTELKLFTPEERVFSAVATPILRDGRTEGAVLVLHDFTELRRLEEVRKEFVANVSHELRTPLASIKGYAETLRRGGLDDMENRVDFVETIEQEADRLTRLVDDLLALASIESGRRPPAPEPVAVGPFVRELLKPLEPLARKAGVALRVSGEEAVRVSADKGLLRQALQNLLDNAIKFNKAGGSVVCAWRREGPRVVITVQDTGVGIPAEDLPRIFERFYRVDKARSRELGGTGLGLSIVKHVAEAHDGRAWAESEDGEGSSFHLELPSA